MGALLVLYIVGMAGTLGYLFVGQGWRTTGRAIDRELDEVRDTRSMHGTQPTPRGRV